MHYLRMQNVSPCYARPRRRLCVKGKLHVRPGQCANLETELAEACARGAEAAAERDALRNGLEEAEARAGDLERARSELESVPCFLKSLIAKCVSLLTIALMDFYEHGCGAPAFEQLALWAKQVADPLTELEAVRA